MQTIKRGSKGTAVKEMQQLLIAAGYSLPKYGADGTFGAESESALREFQSAAPKRGRRCKTMVRARRSGEAARAQQ